MLINAINYHTINELYTFTYCSNYHYDQSMLNSVKTQLDTYFYLISALKFKIITYFWMYNGAFQIGK